MSKISLDYLSVIGHTAEDLVSIAAEAGYDAVTPVGIGLEGFDAPIVALAHDRPAVESFRRHLRDYGMRVHNLDGFVFTGRHDWSMMLRALDIAAELGADNAAALIFDPDRRRALEDFHRFGEEARRRGLGAVIEFAGLSEVRSLADAVDFIARSSSRAQLVVDLLHLINAGETPADIGRVDPALLSCAQICDGPANFTPEQYAHYSIFERQLPGQGEWPTQAFLTALPAETWIGVEIPRPEVRQGRLSPIDHARATLKATRALLKRARPFGGTS